MPTQDEIMKKYEHRHDMLKPIRTNTFIGEIWRQNKEKEAASAVEILSIHPAYINRLRCGLENHLYNYFDRVIKYTANCMGVDHDNINSALRQRIIDELYYEVLIPEFERLKSRYVDEPAMRQIWPRTWMVQNKNVAAMINRNKGFSEILNAICDLTSSRYECSILQEKAGIANDGGSLALVLESPSLYLKIIERTGLSAECIRSHLSAMVTYGILQRHRAQSWNEPYRNRHCLSVGRWRSNHPRCIRKSFKRFYYLKDTQEWRTTLANYTADRKLRRSRRMQG